jgi:cold shock CspA family protein
MDRPVPFAGTHRGRVASFDKARGLGSVTDDTGVALGFHATAIADGSRTIEVGTEVAFVVTPGHRGRYEAGSLVAASERDPAA